MPGKTPSRSNRKEPVENGGVRGNRDVDMKDKDEQAKGKGGKKAAKDGDEGMTVVVPPSKKQSSQAPPDADGDVDMDVGDKADEAKVDPVAQTVAGTFSCPPSH